MTNAISVSVGDGKYTISKSTDGIWSIKSDGKPWPGIVHEIIVLLATELEACTDLLSDSLDHVEAARDEALILKIQSMLVKL